MDTPLSILQKYWGYAKFRPYQEDIIHTVLQGLDVLALMPTGGGKSICFQVPAMLQSGICIVVSPLIALMNDQVAHLQARGISAAALSSALEWQELQQKCREVLYGDYKFVYVSPERLETEAFQTLLSQIDISLLVVDEAHCIAQWGYDFRPSYLRIAQIRALIGMSVPVLALTATATVPVQKDIVSQMHFRKGFVVFRQPVIRDNLAFAVLWPESKINALTDLLHQESGTSIVYCKTRNRVEEIAHILSDLGLQCVFYHAGLSSDDRQKRQEEWQQDRKKIMVCTNAFGMGIDKPDVRLVVHMDAPDSLENYYQEAGRAGRDGILSKAVLLASQSDLNALQALPDVRFPPFSVVKDIYRGIGDYLQVPAGGGENLFFDFDIRHFSTVFHFPLLQVYYSLKELGRQDFVRFEESIFLPSKLKFDIDKASLSDFRRYFPKYDTIIKALLRMYEGIFDYRVTIQEDRIAGYCHVTVPEVVQQLQWLHQRHVVEYLPKKEKPQIYFPHDMAPKEYMNFDFGFYRQQKEAYARRIRHMISYIEMDRHKCRAQAFAAYFGNEEIKPCGICDHCRAQSREKVSAPKDLQGRILSVLEKKGGLSMDEILVRFPYDCTSDMIRFMLDTECIEIRGKGLYLK